MNTRPCKACGVELTFVESNESGKMLPLQKVRSVYTIGINGKAHALPKDVIGRDRYISHFETCPKASSVSKKSDRIEREEGKG